VKKAYVIHRWAGQPNSDWYPWLESYLEQKGYEVKILKMPHTKIPTIKSWVKFLQKEIEPSPETFLIGHSIGCQTILRYLSASNAKKVGGIILVAPWLTLKNLSGIEKVIARPWLTRPIDFAPVAKVSKKLAIFSENDRVVPIENAELFRKELNPEIVIVKDKGHFDESDNIRDLEFLKKNLEEFFD